MIETQVTTQVLFMVISDAISEIDEIVVVYKDAVLGGGDATGEVRKRLEHLLDCWPFGNGSVNFSHRQASRAADDWGVLLHPYFLRARGSVQMASLTMGKENNLIRYLEKSRKDLTLACQYLNTMPNFDEPLQWAVLLPASALSQYHSLDGEG